MSDHYAIFLNPNGAVCQLYFNKTGRKKKEMPQGEGSPPAQVHMVQCGKRGGTTGQDWRLAWPPVKPAS